jgi:hypothetical protein
LKVQIAVVSQPPVAVAHLWNVWHRERMRTAKRILAGFCCLLVLVITLPNLGRPEFVTQTVRYGWPDVLCVGLILLPLVLVLVGINRSKIIEGIGWVLMVVLLVLRFSG